MSLLFLDFNTIHRYTMYVFFSFVCSSVVNLLLKVQKQWIYSYRYLFVKVLFCFVTTYLITHIVKQEKFLTPIPKIWTQNALFLVMQLNFREINFTKIFMKLISRKFYHLYNPASIFLFLFPDHAFPIAFCLVMGAWSDKHGRKPLLLSSQVPT